jgi:hypothetical protein
MKTLIRFLFIAGCIALFATCQKTDQVMDDLSGVELKNAPVVPVFPVEPNGVDDTEAILQAFTDAQAAGPGAIVQLSEGEFHLGFIEIHDFCGIFKGAGQGKTVITAMNNLNSQLLWDQHQVVTLMKFVGGEVQICQMTIQSPPGKLSVTGPPQGHIYSFINFTTFTALYETRNDSRSIHAVVDHVSFIGQTLAGGPGITKGYNCAYAIHAGWDCYGLTDLPREKVNLTVTNSIFDTFYYGIVAEGVKNCQFTIGKSTRGNLFKNSDAGFGIYQYRDIEVVGEGNTFDMNPGATYGIELHDGYDSYYPFFRAETATVPSTFNIGFNVFNMPRSRYALYINNVRRLSPVLEIPSVYQVRNNVFCMENGLGYSRGITCYRTKGMVIRNNRFTGPGNIGIYLLNDNIEGLILGNNFSETEFSSSAVYLHSTTKNWAVVGGDLIGRIINNGTGNVITGMTVSTSDVSLGEMISDDLPEMNHIMH